MPKQPSPEILAQLQEATSKRAAGTVNGDGGQGAAPAAPPPQRTAERAHAAQADQAPAAGSANAQYLLLDHYVGGSYGTLWAYASGAWHSSTTNEPGDEQGIAQVAFASNAVEADWNANGELWLLRCWKYL
ncbi:MAG: hypothetical protein ACXV3A_04395 [Kineosporiaceae bacterium]